MFGMDVQGETILGTYLYGRGKPHDVEDPIWTAYMEAHPDLRHQILSRLKPLVKEVADRKKKGRFPIADTFHAEFPENSGLSGYALLHGSNKDVGDFKLIGWADVEDAVDPAGGDYDIELDLRFVFNDIVDPNPKYRADRNGSVLADIITFGQAKSYRLSIHWSSNCLAEVRHGQPIQFSGYPSDRPRGIRPLPRAKLDWVGSEKQRAKEIETRIVMELRRNISSDDVASLADRKRRLLWLFYRISGYTRSTYLERFSNPAHDDDLPRLFRNRLSAGLRAELMEALGGKRPQGDEQMCSRDFLIADFSLAQSVRNC
jgi:hypothetical protein